MGMQHALVVGGTGMLADVSLWLAEQGYHVSVIGRNRARLARLQERAAAPSERAEQDTVSSKRPEIPEEGSNRITPLAVDYRDGQALRSEIEQTIRMNGPINLVVSWIHAIAPQALGTIDEAVSAHAAGEWRLYHVRGSATAIPKEPANVSPNCRYRQIFLGFVLTPYGSRWLTNDEIASGVIAAIQHDQLESVVGTLEPWDKRP